MTNRDGIDLPRPLPPELLPDPQTPEGHPEWGLRAERVMAAAELGLVRLSRVARVGEPSWWPMLGGWWKPTAALGAAAAAVLLIVEPPARVVGPSTSSVTLSVVAAEGDLIGLWEVRGVEADPVLALIALQDHRPFAERESALPAPGEERR